MQKHPIHQKNQGFNNYDAHVSKTYNQTWDPSAMCNIKEDNRSSKLQQNYHFRWVRVKERELSDHALKDGRINAKCR